jgi:hypothetical protein
MRLCISLILLASLIFFSSSAYSQAQYILHNKQYLVADKDDAVISRENGQLLLSDRPLVLTEDGMIKARHQDLYVTNDFYAVSLGDRADARGGIKFSSDGSLGFSSGPSSKFYMAIKDNLCLWQILERSSGWEATRTPPKFAGVVSKRQLGSDRERAEDLELEDDSSDSRKRVENEDDSDSSNGSKKRAFVDSTGSRKKVVDSRRVEDVDSALSGKRAETKHDSDENSSEDDDSHGSGVNEDAMKHVKHRKDHKVQHKGDVHRDSKSHSTKRLSTHKSILPNTFSFAVIALAIYLMYRAILAATA